MYFNMVGTDPLEMDPLASSDSPPSLQTTYLSMLFIITRYLQPGWGPNLGALHKTKSAPQIAILIKISS